MPTVSVFNNPERAILSMTLGGGDPFEFVREREVSIQRHDVPGFPSPLVVAIAVAGGGDHCMFAEQIFAQWHGRWRALLPANTESLDGGGFFVGDLGHGLGPGVAVWNNYWVPGDVHAGPHHTELQRFRLQQGRLVPIRTLRTRREWGDPDMSISEFGVHYHDWTKDLHQFDGYR